MMTVIVLAVLGWAGYKAFRLNTGAGTEAVRAYYFLEALLNGNDQLNANRYAHVSISMGSTEDIQRVNNEIQARHDGKSTPIVAEAYRRGLTPLMPHWYRNLVSKAPVTAAIKSIYQQPLANLPENAVTTRNSAPTM